MLNLPEPVQSEAEKDIVTKIYLYAIGGDPILYYTSADRSVAWDGKVWLPRGISYSKLKNKLGLEIDEMEISIDNLDETLIAWALSKDPTGHISHVYYGYWDGGEDELGQLTLVNDFAVEEFSGWNTSIKAGDEFVLRIKSGLDMYNQRGPHTHQDTTCRFTFKDRNCGYDGLETSCNLTFQRCTELNNNQRFGGFPDLNSKTNS